jgi:hypothetical protein
MKKICFFSSVFIIIFISCQPKTGNNTVRSTIPAHLTDLNVVIIDTALGNDFENIDFDNLPRMTKALYDSLQISKIAYLQNYDATYLSMGRILLSNENGRIITIQVISDGEIMEYLVSYDSSGRLIDNMLVAYEDMVEYDSEISSTIQSNNITVQTVNFTYTDEDGDQTEFSDTTFTKYRITTELKFILLQGIF